MAHSLSFRRPLPIFKVLRFSPPQIRRQCLSQSSILQQPDPSKVKPQRPRQAPGPSLRVASKEMQQLPTDIGLLEETFITPTGRNAPSLFKEPSSFAKLRWQQIRSRFWDRASLFAVWISSPKEKSFFKRTMKFNRKAIPPTAVALHRQMYTSFAEGNIATLREMCTDGIYESFRARLASRQRGEKVVWELVQYNRGPRLVSHKAAKAFEGVTIRQAVVRISSRQKLTRQVKGKGGMEMVPGSGMEKDVVEYLVIQKMSEKWQEGDWKVWGTTTETSLEDLQEWQEKKLA